MTGISAAGDRVLERLADLVLVALVVGVDRDRHVGEHRLGPRRRDLDRARAVGKRIAKRPELARDLAGLDLEVRNRGLEMRVPIDQALVAVEQFALVELDEHLGDGARKALVHGEALVGPVARRAQAAQLLRDLAAALRLPLPHLGDEIVAAEIGALLLAVIEVALDHHLGRDPGMVGADHPQSVLAVHPRAADEDVLERDVERMADVQAAGDVGRRHDDRIGLGLAALGPELAALLPMRVPARLDRARFEGLCKLAHEARLTPGALHRNISCAAARIPAS